MPSGRNCIKFVESAFGSMSHVWESDGFVNSVNSTHDKISLGDTSRNGKHLLFSFSRTKECIIITSRALGVCFPPL